jgi:hypothetical protein
MSGGDAPGSSRANVTGARDHSAWYRSVLAFT